MPAESSTVVTATGIVAVAGRDTGHPAVSLVLAALASGGLAVIVLSAAASLAMRGHGIADSGDPMGRTVAGGALVQAVHGALASGRAGGLVVIGIWLVATAWIPLLVVAEAHRARARRPGYEPARWSTVFPLGMYSVASATLASIAPSVETALLVASDVFFWSASRSGAQQW